MSPTSRDRAREVVLAWFREDEDGPQSLEDAITAAIDDAVAAERGACAQVAEHLNGWGYPPAGALAEHIAKVIRARAQKAGG